MTFYINTSVKNEGINVSSHFIASNFLVTLVTVNQSINMYVHLTV